MQAKLDEALKQVVEYKVKYEDESEMSSALQSDLDAEKDRADCLEIERDELFALKDEIEDELSELKKKLKDQASNQKRRGHGRLKELDEKTHVIERLETQVKRLKKDKREILEKERASHLVELDVVTANFRRQNQQLQQAMIEQGQRADIVVDHENYAKLKKQYNEKVIENTELSHMVAKLKLMKSQASNRARKNGEQQEEVEKLRQLNQTLRESLDASVQSVKTHYEKQVEALDVRLEAEAAQIAKLHASVLEKDDQISTLQENTKRLDQELQTNLSGSQQQRDTDSSVFKLKLEQTIEDCEQKLQSQKMSLEKQLSALKSDTKDKALLEEQLAELRTELTRKSSLEQDLVDSQSELVRKSSVERQLHDAMFELTQKSNLETELASAHSDIAKIPILEKELLETQSKLAKKSLLEKESTEIRSELTNKSTELAKVTLQLSETQSELAKKSSDVTDVKQQLHDANLHYSTMSKAHAKASNELNATIMRLAHLENEITKLQMENMEKVNIAQSSSTEVLRQKTDLEHQATMMKDLDDKVMTYQNGMAALSNVVVNQKNIIAELKKQKEASAEEIARLCTALSDKDFAQSQENQKEIERLCTALTDKEEQLSSFQTKLQVRESELEVQKTGAEGLNIKLETTEKEKQQEKQNFSDEIQKLLGEKTALELQLKSSDELHTKTRDDEESLEETVRKLRSEADDFRKQADSAHLETELTKHQLDTSKLNMESTKSELELAKLEVESSNRKAAEYKAAADDLGKYKLMFEHEKRTRELLEATQEHSVDVEEKRDGGGIARGTAKQRTENYRSRSVSPMLEPATPEQDNGTSSNGQSPELKVDASETLVPRSIKPPKSIKSPQSIKSPKSVKYPKSLKPPKSSPKSPPSPATSAASSTSTKSSTSPTPSKQSSKPPVNRRATIDHTTDLSKRNKSKASRLKNKLFGRNRKSISLSDSQKPVKKKISSSRRTKKNVADALKEVLIRDAALAKTLDDIGFSEIKAGNYKFGTRKINMTLNSFNQLSVKTGAGGQQLFTEYVKKQAPMELRRMRRSNTISSSTPQGRRFGL